MIVYTHDDIILISGALIKNQWPTIKAAANLLLQEFPEGIIIDCAELARVSDEGAQTFLDAMHDIQSARARIIVCNLPESVTTELSKVPGVRSQLPVADSIDEARASLRSGFEAPIATVERGVLVPVLDDTDTEDSIEAASQLARSLRLPLTLVYLIEVDRNKPLGAPLPDREAEAARALGVAVAAARKQGVRFACQVHRVRDAQEGVLHAVTSHDAAYVALSASLEKFNQERFLNLVRILFNRAPCHVLIARK